VSSQDVRPPQRPLHGHVLLDEGEEPGGPHIWRRLLIIPLLLVLVGGALALYFSPVLRVHRVEVVGTKTVDAYELARASDLEGRSMLTTRLSEIEDKLSDEPMIKSVRAERIWPDTVRLVVEEREPWGYWHTPDGDFVVDSEGVVLEGVSPPSEGLIIYQENATGTFQPGDRVDADAVRLAKQLMEYSASALDLAVVRLEYNDREGLSLVTSADYRVVLGDSHSLDYKLAVWEALEQRLGRDQIVGHVLDLRFGDRPSLR
jgi:cell division septal protein FtsQ